MPTLLVIESSPRGDHSVSRKLTAEFVTDWKAAHPGGTVVNRDLMKTPLTFVDVPWITGAYTPPEQHSPEVKQALAASDKLIAELKAADHIVIGTSMYNFSIPAALKAYIDQIVRIGVTFSASYEGLVKGKKLTVLQCGHQLPEADFRLYRHHRHPGPARGRHRRHRPRHHHPARAAVPIHPGGREPRQSLGVVARRVCRSNPGSPHRPGSPRRKRSSP